jgi:3-isopropylmalate dehydratase small subunit
MVENPWAEETLALDLQENMLLGLFTIWFQMCGIQLFADIFRNNCLNVGVLPFK